jgi:hypothetical protein
MPLHVNDHGELHISVARATLAAGAAAVAGLFLPAAVAAALLAFAVTAAIIPPTNLRDGLVTLAWALATGAGVRLGGPFGQALVAIGVGGSLARGISGLGQALAAGCGAVGALTAGLVTRALAATGALDVLPTGIATLASGATAGLIVGVSSIGRQLVLPRRAIESELAALADGSELGQLLGRAARAYREAVQAMGDDAPAARAAADELVRKMTRMGRRWQELEAQAAHTLPADLHERLTLVGRRIEATSDPLARIELGRTREALAAQLTSLDEIRGGRERVAARLEHQVATLERLRLAALRQRSADVGRLGAELQPVVDELTQAGGDLDIAAEALTEATVAGALSDKTAEALGEAPVAGVLPARAD